MEVFRLEYQKVKGEMNELKWSCLAQGYAI